MTTLTSFQDLKLTVFISGLTPTDLEFRGLSGSKTGLPTTLSKTTFF